jgi:hypothetical protein
MTPSGIRNISVEVAATALSAGANTVVTLPAQTAILAAGVEVTEALAGASALTFDLGTGFDDDAFASAYAMAGKSVGAVAPMAGGMAYFGAQDTIDITVDTLTGTATGGKLRVWAMVMDVDGKGAAEVDRDYLA